MVFEGIQSVRNGAPVRWRWLCPAILVLIAALAFGVTRARAAVAVNTFFFGGQGSASWSAAADAPGDTDGQAIQLTVPNAASYTGVDLQNEAAAAPTLAPSFWFLSSVSGPAQASPRLVIAFSDGGYIDLHPAAWTAGTWTKVDGATSSWDDPGQSPCPALTGVSYQQALACHLADGANVSDLYLVSDASTASGYVNYIDDISYGGTTLTTSGHVAGATAPDVTSFRGRARVSLATGGGTFTAACQTSPADHCHFRLTISAVLKSVGQRRSVRIGTMTGTIGAGVPANLNVTLNARGRSLLLAHQRALHVNVSGSVTDDGGISVPLTKSIILATG
jgi:hypothetical protein